MPPSLFTSSTRSRGTRLTVTADTSALGRWLDQHVGRRGIRQAVLAIESADGALGSVTASTRCSTGFVGSRPTSLTVDQTTAAGVPYRLLPKIVSRLRR
jgi:hypothetical protein